MASLWSRSRPTPPRPGLIDRPRTPWDVPPAPHRSGHAFADHPLQALTSCHVRLRPYISRVTEVKHRTSYHARPVRLSDYRALACKISRPSSTLFASDAKR